MLFVELGDVVVDALLSYSSFVDYQPQGRYLFVALAPMLFLLAVGLLRATPSPSINRLLVWGLLVQSQGDNCAM